MVQYQLMKKQMTLSEASKPFTVAQGRVIDVADFRYNEDYSVTMYLLVEVS